MRNDRGERWCDWCGDDLDPASAEQRKTCSSACQQAAREDRKREAEGRQAQARRAAAAAAGRVPEPLRALLGSDVDQSLPT